MAPLAVVVVLGVALGVVLEQLPRRVDKSSTVAMPTLVSLPAFPQHGTMTTWHALATKSGKHVCCPSNLLLLLQGCRLHTCLNSSSLIFAHVRAASVGSMVMEPNCHPFAYGKYMFMHNGYVPPARASRCITFVSTLLCAHTTHHQPSALSTVSTKSVASS